MNSPISRPNATWILTRRQRTTDIPSVDWWITSRCNLRCDFCYGPVPTKDPVRLRAQIAEAISVSPARAVTFCGGEPLLVRDVAKHARTQQQVGKTTVLNTNGELLRRRFGSADHVPFDVVGISVDGPTSEVHRLMRGQRADFDETIAGAAWVARVRCARLKIATVVSRVNQDYLPQLGSLVRRLTPVVWRIYQYSPWGPQNSGQARHELSEGDFAHAVMRAEAAASPVPVQSSTVATTGGCLIVDPDGNVLSQEGDGYSALGSCLHEPLEDIWARSSQQVAVRENKRWLSHL